LNGLTFLAVVGSNRSLNHHIRRHTTYSSIKVFLLHKIGKSWYLSLDTLLAMVALNLSKTSRPSSYIDPAGKFDENNCCYVHHNSWSGDISY
jgi:hypothetical protein